VRSRGRSRNFELARLKRWKFGAKTEAMTAQQRALFQDTLAEDEASLGAGLGRSFACRNRLDADARARRRKSVRAEQSLRRSPAPVRHGDRRCGGRDQRSCTAGLECSLCLDRNFELGVKRTVGAAAAGR
jgi:Transposase C of IS166 homeodomain